MDNFVTTLLPNDVFSFSWCDSSFRIVSPIHSRLSLSVDEVDGSLHINFLPIDPSFDFNIIRHEHA